MATALLVAATLSTFIWIGLLLFRGQFWRADQMMEDIETASKYRRCDDWPDVVALIPARNEAETIATIVETHGQTDYPGSYSLIVVDDHSDDGTAERAAAIQSTRDILIVSAPDLQSGWSGKLWAVKTGLATIDQMPHKPRYVLLTDADILHAPETARSLVLKAENGKLALVSLMAQLDCRGFWGKLLVPPFIFFFQKLYPFPKINDPTSSQAGAAGGCMLVDLEALNAVGGIEAIRHALIDDCALASALKGKPPKNAIWLGLSSTVKSLRDNRSLESIWTMVARTAFTQLFHSKILLILSIFGMVITYLAGPLALVAALSTQNPALALAGLAAWILSAFAFWPTTRLYDLNLAWTLTLPLAATFYSMMTLSSAINHWRGKGGQWKGRHYTNLTTDDPASSS